MLPSTIILLHLDLILNLIFESARVASGKQAMPPPNPQPLCLTSRLNLHFHQTPAHWEVALRSPTPSMHPYSEHTGC